MFSRLAFLLIVLSIFFCSHAAFIQPLTRTPLRPFSVNQNYTTDYSFSFNIPTAIYFGAFIEVEFPLPYQISSACQAYLKAENSQINQFSCEKTSSSTYLIDVGQLVSGNYELILEGIKNPSAYSASSNLKVRTLFNKNIPVDSNEYFDSIPFLSSPGNLFLDIKYSNPSKVTTKSGLVVNQGYSGVNLGTRFDFTFTLSKGLNAGDSIKFNMPEGFYTVKPTCFHKNSGSYTTAEVLYNNRMIICQAFQHAMSANVTQTVSVIGIVNPGHTGTFNGFSIETMQGLSPNILESLSVQSTVLVKAGSVTVNIASTSLYLVVNTTHQLNLLFENDVPAGSQIWIKIPPGFRYLAPNCTLIKTLDAVSGSQVTCGLAANKTGYIIEGYETISASQVVSVEISVENPIVSASYNIDVFSYSTEYQAKIDEGSGQIIIGTIYGSSRYFASHSLKFTERLEHGETGALEFTFFLNVPLPATKSVFEGGKIVVDIRPPIPKPTTGTIVCFFYNTVPASSCEWDDSSTDKTEITIGTPTTAPYFQTEIPITITTQTDQGFYGVTLPELIQRYKFYFYFYKNEETTFHEVYYEDYIPDPITLPASWYTANLYPLQYNEEAYLRISFTNNYIDLGTNYFFELGFFHTNQAWDYNLGWGAQEWYTSLDLPCIAENLGDAYRCVLKPGGAAGTSSLIQVIGLSTIAAGQTYTLHFPKILFGTSGSANMNFTLYQNTPGETTQKIPIVTTPISFTPNAAATRATTAFNTLTINPNQPDVDATLTFSFTSSANPEMTIYQYPNPFTLESGIVACGGSNTCYAFADPANWIVFFPNPLQGTTTSTALTIRTAPYASTFGFSARTENNGIVQDSRSSNFVLSPGAPTVTFAPSTDNQEVNSNSLVLFDLTFSTVTHLPANASMNVVFTNLVVPDTDSFYCQINAGLTGLDTRDVICQKMSATTIKVFNLEEIAAGTPISLTFQLTTSAQTAVTARVTTYYDRVQTFRVDTGLGSRTLTFQYDNFQNATIINDRSGDKVRVGQTGLFTIQLTPTSTYTGATLVVTFGNDFTLTAATDILLCRVNGIRRRCTFTTGPLTVTIVNVARLAAGTQVPITISSDFSSPFTKGIQAPSVAGWYSVNIAIGGGAISEQIGDFIYIYPISTPSFEVSAVPASAGEYAMYTFNIQLNSSLASSTGTTTRGKMFIDFPVSSEGFTFDLGTGLSTGEYVGCNVQGITNISNIHCRLWQSPGEGLPATVEVIGFDAITDPNNTAFTVRVAKIRNPIVTSGEYVFAIRTQQVNLNTGVVSPIEETTYSLWNQMINYTGTRNVYTAPGNPTFQAGAAPGQSGTTLNINIYDGKALAANDYFVFEFPKDIVPDVTLTPPAGVSLALSFPDCNWVVYQLSTALAATTQRNGNVNTITIPSKLLPEGYDILAYAWMNNQFDNTVNYFIDPASYDTLTGNILGTALLVNQNELVRGRKNTEFSVQFTPSVPIPVNGSILITFPTGFVPHPNCKNSPSTGSLITSSTGGIACIASGTSWVITNFDEIAPGTAIAIYGMADLPDTAGNLGSVSIITYANQATDLATNGQRIEITDDALPITVQNFETLNLDVNPATHVNLDISAKTANYHPLVFEFTTNAVQMTTASTVTLQVDGSTGGFTSTRTTGEPTICYFVNVNTEAITACSVTISTANNVISYAMQPLRTLTATTAYKAVLTTAFATSGNDGVYFPTTAKVYKANLVVAGTTATETGMTFIEVVPAQFSSLTVRSYVITQGDENVIDIDFTATTTITAASRVIVELPTVFNGTAMFDEDIGQSLYDGQAKNCDKVVSTPAALTFSCFFQKGSQNAGTPASIVLYGFSAAFTRLRFAFTVNNPTLGTATVIPITIYSQSGTTVFTKTNYQRVDEAIVVVNAAATVSNNQQNQPTYASNTLSTSTTLSVPLLITAAMQMSDYYVLKTPPMSASAPGAFTTATNLNGLGTSDILVLPLNQYIIIRPNAAGVGAGTYAATIPNIYTPDTASTLAFSGTLTLFSTMAATQVSYGDGAPMTTTTPVTVTLDTLQVRRDSLMTITMNAIFQGVQSVIINVGNRIAVGVDCYENTNSQIQILQCTTDTTNNRVLITLEDKTYAAASRNLIVNVVSTNGATAGAVNNFNFYYYTTVETNPAVTAGQANSYLAVNPGVTLTSTAPVGPEPTQLQFGYVPFREDRDGIVTGDIGDLIVQVTLANALSAGYQVTLDLDNFDVAVTFINVGDVTSRAGVIMSSGNTIVQANAILTNNNVITFTIPAGTNFNAGATVRFRITQIMRAGDFVGITARTTTTDPLEVTMTVDDANGNLVSTEGSAQVASFLTKSINNNNRVPIRLKFTLANNIPANTGSVDLELPAGEYAYDTTSTLVCYFRTYTNELDYTETQAADCQATGASATGLTITATPATALAANTQQELIVNTDSATNPGFAQIGSAGNSATISFSNAGGVVASSSPMLYQYETPPLIQITDFYYTSQYNDPNTIILELTANIAIPLFPTSLIELELTSAGGNIIQSGQTATTREIECGLVGLTARAASASTLRCVIVDDTVPKIRIENYAAIANGAVFYLMLYDLDNTVIAQNLVGGFDAVLTTTNTNTNRQSQHHLTRMFLERAGSLENAALTLNFPTSSSLVYNTATTLSESITWGAGDSCTTDCRLIVRGLDTDWKFEGTGFAFAIDGTTQNVLLDQVNNIFVVLESSVELTAGTAYTFAFGSGNTMTTPTAFENNGGSFEIDFSTGLHLSRVYTLTGNYPNLVPSTSTTTTTAACTGLGTAVPGTNGNVDCVISVRLGTTQITAFYVDFTNTAQYSEVYPYCNAYISAGAATVSQGQLVCSRQDPSAAQARFFVTGFNFVAGSTISFIFRAKAVTSTTITSRVTLQGLNEGAYYDITRANAVALSIATVLSTTASSPATFTIQSTYESRVFASSTSPLRFGLDINTAVTAQGSIEATPTANFGLAADTFALCTLRDESTFGAPYLTVCSYDDATNAYTLDMINAIPVGRYLVKVTTLHEDIITGGVTFPTTTARTDLLVTVNSNANTQVALDSTPLAAAPPYFTLFSVNPLRNKIPLYNTHYGINFRAATRVVADAASETIIVFDFPNPPFDSDMGASTTTFAQENLPYSNGMALPSSFTTLGTNTQASLHYGDDTYPAKVVVSDITAISAANTNIASLSYLKNPAANTGFILRATALNFASGQYYPTVLYENYYVNYFNTITQVAELDRPLGLSFSTLYPYATSTMTLSGKNYGTNIDTTSEIYIKLKNQGAGFDYEAMSSVTCPGYTVDWHESGYIFYLTPTSDLGTTSPTIVCSGFVIGMDSDDILVETGIYKNGYGRIVPSENTTPPEPKVTQLDDTLTITRVGVNINNRRSVNLYRIQYNANGFKFPSTTYFTITLPSILAFVGKNSEYMSIYGLNDFEDDDNGIRRAVDGITNENNNTLAIRGYADYDPATADLITIYIYLRNAAAGSGTISLQYYDEQGNLIISSSPSAALTVSATPSPVVAGTFGPFATDTLEVYWTETYLLGFYLQPKIAMSSANNDAFVITLPTGFAMPATDQLCRYTRDNGAHWIRSTGCTTNGQVVTMPLQSGFDILAQDVVKVMLTNDLPTIKTTGLVRPSTPDLFTFNIKARVSNTVQQSVFLPLILYPQPTTVTTTWYNRDVSQLSVVSVAFSVNAAIEAADFFQLELVTNDEIVQIFPNDLGLDSTEKRILGNCARLPASTLISDNINIDCYITPGSGTAVPPLMAKVVVQNEKGIAANANLRIFIAGIETSVNAFPGGFVFSVMRLCRDDGLGCPIFRKRDYTTFVTSAAVTAAPMSVPTLTGDQSLFATGVSTTFQLSLGNNLLTTDAIVIKTEIPNIHLSSACTSGVGMCINFPNLGWTFFQPTTAMIAGTRNIDVVLDNGVFYDRTKTLLVEADVWNSGIVTQIFTSTHPNYQVMVPALSTIMTQADPAIQRIVRNFDNIFGLTMSNIWRTDLVQRIIVNIPDTYAAIDGDYCRAGCNLDDISSADYFEFACQVTGDRQVLIVIQDTWTTASADYNVLLYYKGFLPVDAATSQTSNSTITSFASMDLNWVVDENTAYSFFIDSVPTPIIRDLNLNLLSFYQRRATILDYVEFYSAIWPYTVYNASSPATQIKKMVFQVDDEYTYPTLSSLLCYMKVIYREVVDCTLQRTDGKTLITVQMPSDYQNGPFLLRITNTQEDLLFIAPDREGEFMFNMTMYNALGQIVEQDTSYMEIDGSVLSSFTAQPILLDPETQTLYDLQFTTSSRVTPQGFSEDGQTVSTQIVLQFQSFDPAFPTDLGTGLTNGSQISCVPVTGITVTQTGQLTCTLVYGTSPDPIEVIITGYDAIPVNTAVEIYIDQIATLALGATSRIKLEIQSLYSDSPNLYVFYDSTEISTNAPTASTARTAAAMTVTQTGSTTLKQPNTYTFAFTTQTALVANRDYIVVYFPDDGYELSGDYSGTTVTVTTPSTTANGYIMPLRNVIYIKVTANLPAGAVTLTIANLPNPSFIISGTLTYTVQTIVNSKTLDVFTANVDTTSVACTLFSNEQITYSSDYARINENTYQISFTVQHDVPATGSLAVIFDDDLYNLSPSDPQCQLIQGVSSNATCSFELFSQQLVRINLNGQKLTSGTQIKLNVINVNNPTDSTKAPVITIESFFDDTFGSTKIICSTNVTLPSFLPLALVQCPVQIQPEINNADKTTDYLVTISCTSSIRNATTIDITFPSDFEGRIPNDVSCSTSGNYFLQDCSLVPRTTQVSVLIAKPNVQKTLVLRIRGIQNPRFQGQYGPFNVQFTQYDVLYAQLDTTKSTNAITIAASNGLLVSTPDILTLSIFPQNFGEVATYYFSLVGLEFKQVPNQLLITFDSTFANNLGSSLTCGIFTPEEQYGSSFALNYESMNNLQTLTCSLLDNHVLSIQLTPQITLSTSETQDLFFFVSNIVNPSLSQKTATTNEFDFNLTFISSNTALLESFNRLEIDFGVPPPLLQIANISATDNNMDALSNYTISLSTTHNLPTSVDNNTQEYEILFAFSPDQYPAFSSPVSLSYSFPGHSTLESESSAFNYNNLVFIDAEYPDLKTSSPFNITLYNMTNPAVNSQCGAGATGIPVKFGAQYLNRELGFVYGRTYSSMDQGNCLPINKTRDAINVFAPLYMRKGLIYTINIEVEEAASDLILTPISSFLIFEPRTISFKGYQTNQATVQVFVSEFISEGQYNIQWKKQETGSITKYLDVPDTVINVVSENTPTTLAPAPTVDVEDIRYVWTGRSARDVFVTLSQQPADGLTVTISSKLQDSKIQGSVDGETFTTFPISITFGPRETKKRFYIEAEYGAQNNALIYTLTGANALAFNQIIPNTAFIIKNYGSTNFQIFSTQQFSVSENIASYLVSLSDIGTIYYMAVATNINTPSRNNIVDGTIPNIPSNYFNSGNLTIERIQDGSSISTFVNFTGLQSQTLYQVYIVARSIYGDYTPITSMNLETSPMSEGVNILIPTFGQIDVPDLLESLSIVLAIDKNRVIFNGAEIYPSYPTANSIGTQINEYRITIAPNPYNNTPTPNQIAQQLLTAAKKQELLDLVPEFFPQGIIRITPVQSIVPRFMVKPSVVTVGYYTLTIQVELVDNGRLYAIATKMTNIGNTKPSSYQISNGLLANNVQVDDRYFKKITTNGNGIGEIVFDELQDFENYNIYITAGNRVPYEPANLMSDSDIVHLTARTNKNPNLGTEDESFDLYKEFYGDSFAGRLSIFYLFIIMLLSTIFYL